MSVPLTESEKAVTELYAKLHAYAKDSYANEQFLPRFCQHMEQLGLDPKIFLRGKSFLDAGCGGYAAGVAHAAVLGAGKILGIDLSNDNVRAARQRFRAYENVHFQQDNLIRLSLPSESFDFVFCVGVLQVTEEPEVAFRELCRILKRGGRIYLGVYGSGGFYHALGVPFYRLAGKLIPQKVTEKVIEKCFPSLLEPARSLMDGMYVRIEQHYKISEIAQWFLRMGMQPTFLRHPEQPDTLLSRILFGEGTMIYFSAIKNGNFDRAS